VDHLRGAGVFKAGAGDWRNGHFQEVGGTVHRVHVLVNDAPHVAALAADDPLDAQPLRLGIDFRVQALDHFMGVEETEIAPLGGVGAHGVIEPDLVEQHQVAHAGVGSRIAK
jgi:hypothetical protein